MGVTARRMPRLAAWNVASWLATAIYGFAITRLVVMNVGDAGYGLWATVGALRGFIFFLDGGLSIGVNRDSALVEAGDEAAAGRVRAGRRVYVGLATLAFTLFVIVAGFPAALLDLSGAEADVARSITIWLGLETAVALLTSPLAAILRGRQQFHSLACVNWAQTVLGVGLLAALAPRFGLEGAAWAVVASRGAVFLVVWGWMRARSLIPTGALVPSGTVRTVLTFAAPLWLVAIGTQLGGGVDVPIVGGVYGAEAAGHYALGAVLTGVGAGVLFAVMGAFFPRLVSVRGAEARHLTGSLIFMATFLAALGFGFIALHADSLLLLWVGRVPELGVDVARIFALCWTLNAMAHVLSSLAIARGVHKIVGPVVLVEAAVNVAISLVLAFTWSPLGPAVATIATMFVSNVIVLPAVLLRRLDITWSEILRPSAWGYLLGALGAAAVGLAVSLATAEPLWSVLLGTLLTGVAAGVALDLTIRGRSQLRRCWLLTRRGGWSVLRRQRAEVAAERRRLDEERRAHPIVWVKQKPPLVTVRIATYNRGQIVADRAIASALAQTHANVEVVVVGDCCDDATARAVLSVKDPRVRFVNLPERGKYPADPELLWMVAGEAPMNHAVDIARGEWIAALDDDDEFTPDHVEVLLDACRSRDLEFVYGAAENEGQDGVWTKCGAWPPRHGHIVHATVMYWSRIGFRHELEAWKLDEPGDWNLWHRMRDAGVRMGFVDHVVTRHYRERRQVEAKNPFFLGRR